MLNWKNSTQNCHSNYSLATRFFLYHIMLKGLKPILNDKNTVKTINVSVFGRQACDNLTIWAQQSWKNKLFCHLKPSIFANFCSYTLKT